MADEQAGKDKSPSKISGNVMSRRSFLKRVGVLAGGAVAAATGANLLPKVFKEPKSQSPVPLPDLINNFIGQDVSFDEYHETVVLSLLDWINNKHQLPSGIDSIRINVSSGNDKLFPKESVNILFDSREERWIGFASRMDSSGVISHEDIKNQSDLLNNYFGKIGKKGELRMIDVELFHREKELSGGLLPEGLQKHLGMPEATHQVFPTDYIQRVSFSCRPNKTRVSYTERFDSFGSKSGTLPFQITTGNGLLGVTSFKDIQVNKLEQFSVNHETIVSGGKEEKDNFLTEEGIKELRDTFLSSTTIKE